MILSLTGEELSIVEVSRGEKMPETKEEFESNLRENYRGAVVYVNGVEVKSKKRIIDKEWWEKKVNLSWHRRRRYGYNPTIKELV